MTIEDEHAAALRHIEEMEDALAVAKNQLAIENRHHRAAQWKIQELETKLFDHAEDWAMAGFPPSSDLAKRLTAHYLQRQREREQLHRCRVVMEANDPINAREIFGAPRMT